MTSASAGDRRQQHVECAPLLGGRHRSNVRGVLTFQPVIEISPADELRGGIHLVAMVEIERRECGREVGKFAAIGQRVRIETSASAAARTASVRASFVDRIGAVIPDTAKRVRVGNAARMLVRYIVKATGSCVPRSTNRRRSRHRITTPP